MAVSPSCMYSSGSLMSAFTHPVPVVPAMARTSRSKAPVRSNSRTASRALASNRSSPPNASGTWELT
jgi:hypothetical protein